jgi:hypothetical protein
MAGKRVTKQLFETTLYSEDEDLAIAVVSVPTENLPDRSFALSPRDVFSALRLRPVAEVPPANVADALTAILATRDADDAAQWLAEPPQAVPITLGADLAPLAEVPRLDAHGAAELGTGDTSVASARAPRRVREVPKADPRAADLREFARDAADDAFVLFQRSPIDLYQLPELLNASRVLIATVQSNPLVVIWTIGGFFVYSAVRGAGRGISTGVQYRLLRLFGLPEDMIRQQMGRRPRR